MNPRHALLPLIALLSLMLLSQGAQALRPDVLELMDHVSTSELNASLYQLEGYGTRFVASVNAPIVVGDLDDRLQAYGWDTEVQEFSFQQDTLGVVTSWNVIARRGGTNPDALIVIGAHWDSINFESPGGSWDDPESPAPGVGDNGSGVAALLEVARITGHRTFRQNVELVFFGGEEEWLQGSRYYVDQLVAQDTNVAGFYNIDTISYDIDETWDFSILSDNSSTWLMWDAAGVCHDYTPELTPIGVYPETWSNSDVFPFWQAHYPAVSVWEGIWYLPYEHAQHGDTSQDTYENAVPDGGAFLTAMTRYALAIFCVWADVGPAPTGAADLPFAEGGALSAWPNPFRDRTSIRLAGRADHRPIQVEIYDLSGRRVAGVSADGAGNAVWDGRGDHGERLAAGVYLLRAEGESATAARRVVLLH